MLLLNKSMYELCVTQIFQAFLGKFHISMNLAFKLEVGFKAGDQLQKKYPCI